MSTQRLATPELVRLFDAGSLAGLSEWELLELFVARRDELAFQVLVSRHGPMVLGICRRMLSNAADAEDAFQVTFLVLLKRAGSLGPGDAIAAWLHGVAVRVAQQARSAAARRGRRERPGMTLEIAASEPTREDHELRQILDEEIHRLPQKYRAPIVLCYLEGQTHEEAARQLDWPLGTVKGRLARARSILESRLSRRGVACGAALTALAAGSGTEAAVPVSLMATTCNAAARIGSGTLIANAVSGSIAQLIQGVLSTMIMQKLKSVAVAFVVSGLFVTGAGVVARQQISTAKPQPAELVDAPGRKNLEQPKGIESAKQEPAASLVFRDQRNLQRELIDEASRAYSAAKQEHIRGPGSLDRVHSASLMLMEAEHEAAASPTARFDAVEGHFQRMKELAHDEQARGKLNDSGVAQARAYQLKAELEVAKANAWQPGPAGQRAQAAKSEAPAQGDGKSQGPGKDPRSRAVLAKLEEPIAMSFPQETPLEDLLKYIKQATTGPTYSGIPIYVDPMGLQEAEKTLTSTIQLDLDGIPLRRSLQLALKQIGLGYFVDDGILVITSQESGDQAGLDPDQLGPSPFMKKQDKLERGEMTVQEMKAFAEELKVKAEIMKQLRDLKELEQGHEDPNRSHAVNADQAAPLLKEMKALIEQLKAEREKPKKSGSQ